jgi:hypothetical protein
VPWSCNGLLHYNTSRSAGEVVRAAADEIFMSYVAVL